MDIKIAKAKNGQYVAYTTDNVIHFRSTKLGFVRKKAVKFANCRGLNFVDIK